MVMFFLGLAVAQTNDHSIHPQWIFSWVIFAVFLLDSLYLSSVKYSGRDMLLRSTQEPGSTDAERAPLLDDSVPGPTGT